MCELLGTTAKRKRRVDGLLREFYSHAEAHPHGWGLARFPDGAAPYVEREAVKATESACLRRLLAEPVEARTILAHIRFATVGELDNANCHPFTATDNRGRVWTLAHNGTIFNGADLNAYAGVQYGDTDSERVLLHFVSLIDREQIRLGRALDGGERFDVLAAAVAELSKGNKLNLLIFDGEVMYAHCNFRGTLHVRREDYAVTFSTRPLSGDGWKELPFTSLVAAREGKIVRASPPHGNEYIYNSEDYRMVYMDFARL
ncbi:MAG: class II glutamine amidotransferase [Kiritimatiellia bacterium]